MTLYAGLANSTSLQSFMVWYCSVCELRYLNSKKKKEKMKNFGAYGRIGIFYLTPFPCTNLRSVVYFDELSHVTVLNLTLTSY